MKLAKWDMDSKRYVHRLSFLVSDVWKSFLMSYSSMLQEPDGGTMKGLAFAYDPDGYWVEIVPRGGLEFGDNKAGEKS